MIVVDIIGKVHKETVGEGPRPKPDQCLCKPCFVCNKQCFQQMEYRVVNIAGIFAYQLEIFGTGASKGDCYRGCQLQLPFFFLLSQKFASGFCIYISQLSELCAKTNMSTTFSLLCGEIKLPSFFNCRLTDVCRTTNRNSSVVKLEEKCHPTQ